MPRSKAHKSNNSKVSQKIPPGGSLPLKDKEYHFIRDQGSDPSFFPGQGKRSGTFVHISEIMAQILPLNLNNDNLNRYLTGDVDGITISDSENMVSKGLKLSLKISKSYSVFPLLSKMRPK